MEIGGTSEVRFLLRHFPRLTSSRTRTPGTPASSRARGGTGPPRPFDDGDLALLRDKNHKQFPTETLASVYDYSREIPRRLRMVHVPIRIRQSKKDQIISPVAARDSGAREVDEANRRHRTEEGFPVTGEQLDYWARATKVLLDTTLAVCFDRIEELGPVKNIRASPWR